MSSEQKEAFLAAFKALVSSDEQLYSTLLERAQQEPTEELARRLELLSLQGESKSGDAASSTESLKVDLSQFSSQTLLEQLQAFAVYLCQKDAINLTKVLRLFASYSDFTRFEQPVKNLFHLHPEYTEAMSAL